MHLDHFPYMWSRVHYPNWTGHPTHRHQSYLWACRPCQGAVQLTRSTSEWSCRCSLHRGSLRRYSWRSHQWLPKYCLEAFGFCPSLEQFFLTGCSAPPEGWGPRTRISWCPLTSSRWLRYFHLQSGEVSIPPCSSRWRTMFQICYLSLGKYWFGSWQRKLPFH